MSVFQIVFSPTGGTQKVADTITLKWDKPARKIDLSDPKTDFAAISLEKEDIAVIAVPSFGGRVPALAVERLEKIHGNGAMCVAVCVYGNRAYEDTLIELNDAAAKSGFQVIAGIAAIAEHSIMHQYATGRPDEEDRTQLQGFAEKILEKISNADMSAPQIPGNRPYKKAGGAGLVPKADHKCNACGLCAEKCPAQAISRENPRETDGKKCISCMRCISVCPQSARKVNSAMVSVAAMAIKKACSEKKSNELFL
ncbi:MAG TPA: 4Fe-4S binding protein [Candidatus Eisenbergiella stercoravium]|nr:4Fe-4S binding protein [Candidatus Eisenbergiella stercoravium]